MAESSNDEERRKETARTNEYFVPANYQHGLMVPPHYFTQPLYYPYVNPYSHLTESNGNVSIHGYGSDGRPKFRRSRTIFSPEQLDILEEHFEKYKYPDVKRRRIIAEDVGLPEERVQVWFQNRRAKDKRQTDQHVKLQKLVDQAMGTNTGNEHQHLQNTQRNSDRAGGSVSNQNLQECQQSPFGQPHPHDTETENDDNRTFHRRKTKSPSPDNPEMGNQKDSLSNCSVDSRDEIMFSEASGDLPLPQPVESTSQNMWMQADNPTFGTPEAQVAIQNIDQDLLFKVANILSASNDATSLISQWSQAPNKTHTNNLEEQLRHFAEHHQQVLIANRNAGNTNTPSNNTTQETG